MASSTMSNYLSTALMNHTLRGEALTAFPTSLWLALFTTTPGLNGTGGVEVSTAGTGYARVELQRSTSTWTTATGSNLEYSNVQELVFPVPTGNWGTVVSLGIYDAATAGNLYFISAINTAKPIQNGDGAPRILASQLKILRAVC